MISLPIEPADHEDAAPLYRLCRREGDTVRRPIDCLIGSVAMRASAVVLYHDSDLDVLAHHTGSADRFIRTGRCCESRHSATA